MKKFFVMSLLLVNISVYTMKKSEKIDKMSYIPLKRTQSISDMNEEEKDECIKELKFSIEQEKKKIEKLDKELKELEDLEGKHPITALLMHLFFYQ